MKIESGRWFKAALLLLFALPASAAMAQRAAPSHSTQGPPAPSGSSTFTVSDFPSGRLVRIVVYGDMRFTDPATTGDTSPKVRKWLVDKVGEEKPDLLLLTGDMPFHGSDPKDWAVYDDETASWTVQHLRIYPTLGNHELIPDQALGLKNYFQAYPQIDGNRWYSVRLGNIYVITLDSTTYLSKGSVQRAWLDAQLDHLPDSVDFVFFLFHVPLVADLQTSFILGLPSPESLELRQEIEDHAAKSSAKFVIFNGHVHNYERFDINGIMHVITGGGGARPYPIFLRGDQDLYRGNTYPNFNYVLITLQGKHADAQMYRVKDPNAAQFQLELKDSFTLDAK